MHYRLFNLKHKLYTNSPFWPSNQRSTSKWFLSPSGQVIEAVSFEDLSDVTLIGHDIRDFAVEPWTGYFDQRGKKIYRGDILGAFRGILYDEIDPSYEVEVVWHEGGFSCKDSQQLTWPLMPLHVENRAWKRQFIKGNIHGVEYND